MLKLVKGIQYFQNEGFQERRELFSKLKDGQHPEALFITCADSRIDPNLITRSEPGDLFIIRNVGNMVPCYGIPNNGEMAAVEYSIKALGVEDIIVCGHTCCGAMGALVNPPKPGENSPVPTVRDWLRHADATAEIVREHYQHLEGVDLINAAAEENVLVQLEHLRTHPLVASRVAAGKLRLHGMIYKIETGEVFDFSDEAGKFIKVDEENFVEAGTKLSCEARFS